MPVGFRRHLVGRGVYAIKTMEQMHHEKIGGRFLQELGGGIKVRELFVHFPPKFLQ